MPAVIATLPPAPARTPGESLVAYERSAFEPEVRCHSHDDAELTLVLDGRGVRRVGDLVERYARGDLCLLADGTPHVWQSRDRGVRALIVRFSRQLVALHDSIPELRGLGGLLDRARGGLSIQGKTRHAVRRQLVRLFGEPAGSWRRPSYLLEALSAVAGGEARVLAGFAPAAAAPSRDERLARVLLYIEQELADGVTFAEAADMAGLTAAAFSRFFRRKTGRTFEDYVNEARVARACRALLDNDRCVTEVAYDAGFGSLAHFHRRFRRTMGMNPTAYRQMGARAGN
jgi:AraC-like DNA-binding protein